MKTAYQIRTDSVPISLSRVKPSARECGNCHTADIELFEVRGQIQLGKREVRVCLQLCLTCIDHWFDFIQGGRLDGKGRQSRDHQWYPEER